MPFDLIICLLFVISKSFLAILGDGKKSFHALNTNWDLLQSLSIIILFVSHYLSVSFPRLCALFSILNYIFLVTLCLDIRSFNSPTKFDSTESPLKCKTHLVAIFSGAVCLNLCELYQGAFSICHWGCFCCLIMIAKYHYTINQTWKTLT